MATVQEPLRKELSAPLVLLIAFLRRLWMNRRKSNLDTFPSWAPAKVSASFLFLGYPTSLAGARRQIFVCDHFLEHVSRQEMTVAFDI
jgi:hypothetical protein